MIGIGSLDKNILNKHKTNLIESIKTVQNELKDSVEVQTK